MKTNVSVTLLTSLILPLLCTAPLCASSPEDTVMNTSAPTADAATVAKLRAETARKIHAEWLRCADRMARIIRNKKKGSRLFAEDVTTIFAIHHVTDMESYTKQKFAEHIFTQAQLSRELEACVQRSRAEVERMEDELALALEKIGYTEPLPTNAGRVPLQPNRQRLTAICKEAYWYQRSLDSVSVATGYLAEQIVVRVVTMLASRAAVMGVAATTGTVTCGAGLVLGLAADCAVTAIWDPADKVESEINSQLDDLANQVKADFLKTVENYEK